MCDNLKLISKTYFANGYVKLFGAFYRFIEAHAMDIIVIKDFIGKNTNTQDKMFIIAIL